MDSDPTIEGTEKDQVLAYLHILFFIPYISKASTFFSLNIRIE